jgi:hypothetical protein
MTLLTTELRVRLKRRGRKPGSKSVHAQNVPAREFTVFPHSDYPNTQKCSEGWNVK